MSRVGGRNKNAALMQRYIVERAQQYGISLRETAGSGNVFASDSDIQNRLLQIEAKQRTNKDGIFMPSKSDWKKLIGEARNTGRFPILCTSGSAKPSNETTLVTLKLDHLLYLMQGIDNE